MTLTLAPFLCERAWTDSYLGSRRAGSMTTGDWTAGGLSSRGIQYHVAAYSGDVQFLGLLSTNPYFHITCCREVGLGRVRALS